MSGWDNKKGLGMFTLNQGNGDRKYDTRIPYPAGYECSAVITGNAIRMMTIKDLEYLKGFTMLPVKDPLVEAWTLLKNVEEIDKGREFSDPVDPMRELGHTTSEKTCSVCQGMGLVAVGREGVQTTVPCSHCKGTGYDTEHTTPDTVPAAMVGY